MPTALPLSSPLPLAHPSSRRNQTPSLQKQSYLSQRYPSSINSRPSAPPTLSPWVQTLRAHTLSNRFQEALHVYVEMISAGVLPDEFAFPAAIKSAAGLHDLNSGQQVHAAAIKHGYASSSVIVANTLITMYGKCGAIGNSCQVFERISPREQVSWNSMISAFCQCEEWALALEEFQAMQEEQVELSSFTLVSIVLAASHLEGEYGLRLGKQIHGYGLRAGYFCSDGKSFTRNALMAMYSKLGRVDDSYAVFQRLDGKDVVAWNTMISSFAQNDRFAEALRLLRQMTHSEVKPDQFTIASVLPACSHLQLLDIGKQIHAFVLRNDNLSENSFIGSALVDMYCNCGIVKTGRHVFDSISEWRAGLWNSMITGYAQSELDEEALRLFIDMEALAGLSPNATTMASVLPACARCEAFPHKEGFHGYVLKRGFGGDRYVQNALLDMYARIGKLEVSQKIFEELDDKDLVSWNTMITGYIVNGRHEEALRLLSEILLEDNISGKKFSFKPNSITLMAVLPGCAILAALGKGKEIHAYAVRNELASDITVGSALVDMYAKSGCLTLSRRVFDQMPKRCVITWNALIMAYGMHGHGEEALKLFKYMTSEGEVKPNGVTYIVLFAAFSHSGMVREGLKMFYRMKEDYGIEPAPEHYACMIDLLGRAGELQQAHQLIMTMPKGECQLGAWCSFLGACRVHGNVELGVVAAKNLLHLEPHVDSHYVLLSNIYASAGQWDEAMEVRKDMRERGVRKKPGCSWIEYGDKVHRFMAGDASHPQSAEIQELMERLSEKMKKEGYVPDTSCVLHNLKDEEKELLLCGHSERLAIAFGILNTAPGATIRITKNLRVCNDCHEATKYISKIEGREIIVRDFRRFHYFKDGSCSCGDYW
ncbi:hypothetical protein ACLOJK_029897 [Asimina triloba]